MEHSMSPTLQTTRWTIMWCFYTETSIEEEDNEEDSDDIIFVSKDNRTMRNILGKRKSPSYIYSEIQRKRKLHCVCQKPENDSLCTECKEWYHPECIQHDKKDSPKPFYCPSCLSKLVKDMEIQTFDTDEKIT
ncbi:hypothetical protein ACF0H5_016820 [Mactra antiquata]